MPPTHVFPDAPPANSVYMTDAPPPYPGINGFNGYTNGAQVEEDGLEYLHKYCSNKIKRYIFGLKSCYNYGTNYILI